MFFLSPELFTPLLQTGTGGNSPKKVLHSVRGVLVQSFSSVGVTCRRGQCLALQGDVRERCFAKN